MRALLTICLLAMFVHAGAQNSGHSVKFYLGETVLDASKGIAAADLAELKIKFVPDSEFAATHPNDKFTLRGWRLYLRRGTDLGSPIEGSGETLPLVSFVGNKGDVISIEIQNIVHTDANGKTEKLVLTAEMKYLSIAIK